MKYRAILSSFIIIGIFISCKKNIEMPLNTLDDLKVSNVAHTLDSTLIRGSSYLAVYSQIYSQSEHRTHDLTATVSIRNINKRDTVFINKATYFNTHGKAIRTYIDTALFVAPMQTIEIVIAEKDQEGGTGANLVFDWLKAEKANSPLFECIMISTQGQQGLSFTTHGKIID